jgi:hypothetical protein
MHFAVGAASPERYMQQLAAMPRCTPPMLLSGCLLSMLGQQLTSSDACGIDALPDAGLPCAIPDASTMGTNRCCFNGALLPPD